MKAKIPNNRIVFQHSFKVKSIHIDTLNHVNNVVYLQWSQEIAYKHWESLAPNEIKKKYIWMVLRHEIDYLSQAYLDDEITVYTWIEENQGVKSTRIVHIYRKEEVLVKLKTIFCLLDAIALKPKRIDTEITTLFTKQS